MTDEPKYKPTDKPGDHGKQGHDPIPAENLKRIQEGKARIAAKKENWEQTHGKLPKSN